MSIGKMRVIKKKVRCRFLRNLVQLAQTRPEVPLRARRDCDFAARAGNSIGGVKFQRDQAAQVDEFYWDDPYPIALELLRRHPGVDPLSVSWETLHRWVVELPQFADDTSVTSLNLLEDIQKEWYEEVTSR